MKQAFFPLAPFTYFSKKKVLLNLSHIFETAFLKFLLIISYLSLSINCFFRKTIFPENNKQTITFAVILPISFFKF